MKKLRLFPLMICIIMITSSCTNTNPKNESSATTSTQSSTKTTSQVVDTTASSKPIVNSNLPIPIEELPVDYPSEMAAANGDYVDIHGEIINQNIMDDFLLKISNKEAAFVRTVRFTIEGDPIITDFTYENGKFKVTEDISRDKFTGTSTSLITTNEYTYLTVYEDDAGKYFIVTDQATISDKDMENGYDGVLLKYEASHE